MIKKPFKDILIDQVRLMGEMLIDNAEEIVGDMKGITELNVILHFPQTIRGFPTMTIDRHHTPKGEALMKTIRLEEDKQ